MNCDQARHLLSLEPRGTLVPRTAAVRLHLDGCAACRSYWRELIAVDRALAAWPLPSLPASFVDEVMSQVYRYPRRQVAPPFSRGFYLFGAALAASALAGGALLLQRWSAPSAYQAGGLAGLWVRPVWAASANAWLSLESERVAQVILPFVVGILITLAAVAIGFRASDREPPRTPQPEEHVAPPGP